jgi:flagellar protein FlaG
MNVSLVGQSLSTLSPQATGANSSAPAALSGRAPVPASSGQALAGSTATAGAARSEQLQQAVNTVNKFIEPAARNLEFQVDAQSGRTVMRLIDKETGSVLRQMPSEEMLAIARALDKLSGLVIKLKA